MTWIAAESEWRSFLESVREARSDLHCSESGSWFRGVSNRAYGLIPSLFRDPRQFDPDSERDRVRCEKIIESFRLNYRSARELADGSASRAVDRSSREEIGAKLRDTQARLRREKDSARAELAELTLVPAGERDAYVEWCFRSGKKDEPSWLILAEMQHSGLPTRLLDWSESLLVSLFFATKKYREAVDSHCTRSRIRIDALDGEPASLGGSFIEDDSSPAIWIANPYRISERSTDRTRIWDLSRDQFDYYEAFISKRKWPFKRAVPAFSPWSSGRIAAQQGLFLVWGHDRRPLEQQFGRGFVRKVDLSPRAALYAVRFLREIGGLDHFSLYRDLDSLAIRLREKFYDR